MLDWPRALTRPASLTFEMSGNKSLPTTPKNQLCQNAHIKKVAVIMPGYQTQFLEFDQVLFLFSPYIFVLYGKLDVTDFQ